MSIKIDRLEHIFIEEISDIIKNEVRDKSINFVTISAVKITTDLSFAKIYVTVLDDLKRDDVINSLNRASKFIERELCKRVDIRKMPELHFIFDESIEYGNKIESIIDNINKEDKHE